jgi:hypothetical protein
MHMICRFRHGRRRSCYQNGEYEAANVEIRRTLASALSLNISPEASYRVYHTVGVFLMSVGHAPQAVSLLRHLNQAQPCATHALLFAEALRHIPARHAGQTPEDALAPYATGFRGQALSTGTDHDRMLFARMQWLLAQIDVEIGRDASAMSRFAVSCIFALR